MPLQFRPRAVPQKRRRKGPGQFTVVESITRPDPQWLPWVITLQNVTKPVALLSLASVLVVYGMNVAMEREWGQKFKSLGNLQHQKNSLVTLTERQKYQLPRRLEVAPKDYVELKQDRVLFINPDSPRPLVPKTQTPRQSLLREDRLPIGY